MIYLNNLDAYYGKNYEVHSSSSTSVMNLTFDWSSTGGSTALVSIYATSEEDGFSYFSGCSITGIILCFWSMAYLAKFSSFEEWATRFPVI